MGLDKDMSVYTYDMLQNGIDRRSLIHVDENILRNEGGISNSIHRMKVLHAIKGKATSCYINSHRMFVHMLAFGVTVTANAKVGLL